MDNLGLLLLALVIGVAVGAFGAWLVLRARATSANDTDAERLRAAEASARADVERARADIAGAHAKASQAEVRIQEARAEAERAQRTVAEARVEAAEASQMAAEQAALVAGLQAKVVAALAERDAASARAAEIAADREAIAKEFQLLSARVLDEQGKKADLSAEQRLKATEHLMTPVRESLEKLDERLNAVEKERVAMATELRQQVEAVRLTGDEAAPRDVVVEQGAAQAAGAGRVGRDAAQAGRRSGRHARTLRLRAAADVAHLRRSHDPTGHEGAARRRQVRLRRLEGAAHGIPRRP